ncbi:uncharacterized protein VNE69_08117 [Vairimorpha necatrix]|uniref:Uncharacterized protein n=1 Tax=Vairimorpha necatrix TaxID=6039 RepID=A0AAX4JEF5_9MICR
MMIMFATFYNVIKNSIQNYQYNESYIHFLDFKINSLSEIENIREVEEEYRPSKQDLFCDDNTVSYNKQYAINNLYPIEKKLINSAAKLMYKIFLNNKNIFKILQFFDEHSPLKIDFEKPKHYLHYINSFITKNKIRKHKLPIKRFIMSLAWHSYKLIYNISLLKFSDVNDANNIYIWSLIYNGIDMKFRERCPQELKNLFDRITYENCMSTIDSVIEYKNEQALSLMNVKDKKIVNQNSTLNFIVKNNIINLRNVSSIEQLINSFNNTKLE